METSFFLVIPTSFLSSPPSPKKWKSNKNQARFECDVKWREKAHAFLGIGADQLSRAILARALIILLSTIYTGNFHLGLEARIESHCKLLKVIPWQYRDDVSSHIIRGLRRHAIMPWASSLKRKEEYLNTKRRTRGGGGWSSMVWRENHPRTNLSSFLFFLFFLSVSLPLSYSHYPSRFLSLRLFLFPCPSSLSSKTIIILVSYALKKMWGGRDSGVLNIRHFSAALPVSLSEHFYPKACINTDTSPKSKRSPDRSWQAIYITLRYS